MLVYIKACVFKSMVFGWVTSIHSGQNNNLIEVLAIFYTFWHFSFFSKIKIYALIESDQQNHFSEILSPITSDN